MTMIFRKIFCVFSVLLIFMCSCTPTIRFSSDIKGKYNTQYDKDSKSKFGKHDINNLDNNDKKDPSIINGMVGYASFYSDKFQGKITASGEVFSQNEFTAAHRDLPFGTMVRVTRISNGKSVVVRINDRGPFVSGRIIDLSFVAAQALDMIIDGVAEVELTVIK